jgi:L-arabinokinase
MKKVLAYVSGHGYGHSTRMAEVIRCLSARQPDWKIYLATSAPSALFRNLAGANLCLRSDGIDSGVVENGDSLHVVAEATIGRLQATLQGSEQIIAKEAVFVNQERINVILADIPFLAGNIAAAAGVPCIGISNFTWDWIYEPHLNTDSRATDILSCIRNGYSRMTTYLKLPFGHPVDVFDEIIEVDLVARRSTRDRGEIARRLSLNLNDSRPRILLGMRRGISLADACAAARTAQEFVFFYPGEAEDNLPSNLRCIPWDQQFSFPDLMQLCNAVIAKLGYGIVSEAVANGIALLYPPRTGFREDELLRVASAHYLRAQELPLADFYAGNWTPYLRQLMNMPAPVARLRMNGADTCAKIISSKCS